MVPDIVRNLPPAPDDVVEWIIKDCVKQKWMFYSKKEDWARCSNCGEIMGLGWFDGAEIYNGQPSECPYCRAKGTFRPQGIGRKKLEEGFRVMICVPDGEKVVVAVAEVIAEFEEPGQPEIRRQIRQILQFGENGSENWYFHLLYYSLFEGYVEGSWEKRKTIYVYTPGRCGWHPVQYDTIYLYDKNLNTLNVGPLKYADIDDYASNMELTPKELIKYMDLCIKYPQSEKLRKFGCNKLITDYINNKGPKNAVNWKGETIQKMLRCNMQEAREIRDFDAGANVLRMYQKMRRKGHRLSIDAAGILESSENIWTQDKKEKELINPKVAQYLADQNRKHNEHNRMVDYIDYYRQCEELEYDWHRKRNQFPINLAKTHRELTKKIEARKKAVDEVKYRETINTLRNSAVVEYEDDKFFVKVPETAEEIRREGEKQHHCVGRYVDQVIRGVCFIAFLRKKEEPDKPFYTVELSPDFEIKQCRGLRNCSKTPEVEAFVKKWEAAIEAEKKREKKLKRTA